MAIKHPASAKGQRQYGFTIITLWNDTSYVLFNDEKTPKITGVKKDTLVEGVEESNMKELAEWVMNPDKIINY